MLQSQGSHGPGTSTAFPDSLRIARRALAGRVAPDVYADTVYLCMVALCLRAHGVVGIACSTHLIAALRQLRGQYIVATADGSEDVAVYVLAAIRHLESRAER